MRLGVLTLQNAPWRTLVERWRALDELGVETIWVADHLANWMRPEQPWFEAWSCVAALAHLTSRAPHRHARQPDDAAQPGCARAHGTHGRRALRKPARAGYRVGADRIPRSRARRGDRWEPKERARLFGDWTERLTKLLGDERFQPKADVPLTIAGRGRTILSLAARYATRWNTFGGVGLTPDEAVRRGREDNERLDELCAETGRSVLRSALIGYSFVGETPWSSDESFADLVGRWRDAGFEELVVYYPPETGMPEGSVAGGVFERAFSKG